jgi:type IV pilus assembly protein PilE
MWILCRPPSARPAAAPRPGRGFSLIELMIALVVLGLLAGVALPSFLDAIRKSRRSDAMTALNTVMQAQERFRSNRAAYASSLTNGAAGDPPGLGLSATSPSGYYTLSLSNVNATGYAVTAVPTSGSSQSKDGPCARLKVEVLGGNIKYLSAGGAGDFSEDAGKRCWSR